MHNVEKNIVFYDGNCILCSRSVRILLHLDKRQTLKFSLLQGEYIKKLVPKEITENAESILFWDGEKMNSSSDAILGIMQAIQMPKIFLWFLKFFPKRFLDYMYYFIAKNRYNWFGMNRQCFIPKIEETKRFLP